MIKVNIKIVGSVTNETELDEIQSIAKIFIYERRMKTFKYPIHIIKPIKKEELDQYPKPISQSKSNENSLPLFKVRGLA